MKPTFEITPKDIPIIQQAMLSSLFIGRTPKDLYLRLINLYWEYYKQLGEDVFLDFCYIHLLSYLKAEYDYKDYCFLFQDILRAKGYDSIEDYLKSINYKNRKVELTKYRILMILGKGNTLKSVNKLTKNEMIDDIINKIRSMEKGRYAYATHQHTRIKITLLIIDDECAYMQDSNGISYQFLIN